jgi:hypothetical protein
MLRLLNAFRLAGAPQPSTEEAAGTSGNSGTLLMSGRGFKNIITNDLLDDPLLSVDNMRYFQKISKEMYRFTLVRHDCSSAIMLCRVVLTSQSSPLYRMWPDALKKNLRS